MTPTSQPVSTADYPAWLREPAKLVGWVVAAVLALAAGVTELVAEFSDLIPERYKATVQTVVAVAAVVTVVATRVQALMTRHKVYAPATVQDAAAMAKLDVHTDDPSQPS